MKKIKKVITIGMVLIATMSIATGCGNSDRAISVVSREDSSGTRRAFVELFGVEQKKDDKKVDCTTQEANITNSTSVMMTTVSSNEDAIGYISLGALNDSVKALKINGVAASAENIKSGEYEISRPFNIATKGQVSEAADVFITYILSTDGQKVVEESGIHQSWR